MPSITVRWHFLRYVRGDEPSIRDCSVCRATGRVDSRLPFRKKICGECGGTGKVSAARREQLLKKSKAMRA